MTCEPKGQTLRPFLNELMARNILDLFQTLPSFQSFQIWSLKQFVHSLQNSNILSFLLLIIIGTKSVIILVSLQWGLTCAVVSICSTRVGSIKSMTRISCLHCSSDWTEFRIGRTRNWNIPRVGSIRADITSEKSSTAVSAQTKDHQLTKETRHRWRGHRSVKMWRVRPLLPTNQSEANRMGRERRLMAVAIELISNQIMFKTRD